MTRVRMRTVYAGPAGAAQAGAVLDLDDEQAQALIDSGNAEAVLPPEAAAEAAEEAESAAETALKNLSVADLRAKASELGIDGATKMLKAELIAAIEDAQASQEPEGEDGGGPAETTSSAPPETTSHPPAA